MEPLHYLALAGQDLGGAHSALPGAPVLAGEPRPSRTRAVRGVIAHSLHRLGDAVAPASAAPSANSSDPLAA